MGQTAVSDNQSSYFRMYFRYFVPSSTGTKSLSGKEATLVADTENILWVYCRWLCSGINVQEVPVWSGFVSHQRQKLQLIIIHLSTTQ